MFLNMAGSPIALSKQGEFLKTCPKKGQSISEGGQICIVKSINNGCLGVF